MVLLLSALVIWLRVKQQTNTLHIGTYILSENSKNNTQSPNQTRYQLPAESGLIHLVNQGAKYLAA
jgi:hypothetical protein